MLPSRVKELADGFVRAYDAERPLTREVNDTQQRAIGNVIGRGFGPCGHMLGVFMKMMQPYLDERAAFIRDKLKESVVAAQPTPYPDMAQDLKSLFESHVMPAIEAAEQGFRRMMVFTQSPSANPNQARTEFSKSVPRFKADLDLFCAQYSTDMDNKAQKAGNTNITYNVSGDNARVVIGSHDYSINIANSKNIFSELTKVINDHVEDAQKRDVLLAKTSELEQSVGKPTAFKKYSEWVELAANHMTLLGPFIPALTKLIGQVIG
jgi:hypothetical protein